MELNKFRITRALMAAGLAVAALLPAGAAQAASGNWGAGPRLVSASGRLTDLSPSSADPTDWASATLVSVSSHGRTKFKLSLQGLSPGAAGTTFGAHIHIGPCVAGEAAKAGPHYNTGSAPSSKTEVWLDFTVKKSGMASSRTTVPFVIPAGGAQSLVIHKMATDMMGGAGARMACLPVQF